MSNISCIYSILARQKFIVQPLYFAFQKKDYAKAPGGGNFISICISDLKYLFLGGGVMGGALKKKKIGKVGAILEKTVLPVETDPERLVNYACGTNIYKTGEDVKLGADEDYPDWLWKIRIGAPPPLEDLDPNSLEYWRRVRKMAMKRNTQLRKLKKF